MYYTRNLHSFRQPFLHNITITPETLSLSQSALVTSSSVEIDSLLYLVCVGHILVVTCNAGHSQRTERHTKTITKSNASPFQLWLNLMTTYQINLEQGSKLIKFPAPALSLISDIQGMPKSGHLPAKNICAFNPKAKEFPCQLRNPEDPDCTLLRNGDPSPNELNYMKAPFLNHAKLSDIKLRPPALILDSRKSHIDCRKYQVDLIDQHEAWIEDEDDLILKIEPDTPTQNESSYVFTVYERVDKKIRPVSTSFPEDCYVRQCIPEDPLLTLPFLT